MDKETYIESNQAGHDYIVKLEKENLALTHLAINFITHSVEISKIQMKCFAGEYIDVKDVGINIPSYQTTVLHRKLKAVSEMDYDNRRCGEALEILLSNKNKPTAAQGEVS